MLLPKKVVLVYAIAITAIIRLADTLSVTEPLQTQASSSASAIQPRKSQLSSKVIARSSTDNRPTSPGESTMTNPAVNSGNEHRTSDQEKITRNGGKDELSVNGASTRSHLNNEAEVANRRPCLNASDCSGDLPNANDIAFRLRSNCTQEKQNSEISETNRSKSSYNWDNNKTDTTNTCCDVDNNETEASRGNNECNSNETEANRGKNEYNTDETEAGRGNNENNNNDTETSRSNNEYIFNETKDRRGNNEYNNEETESSRSSSENNNNEREARKISHKSESNETESSIRNGKYGNNEGEASKSNYEYENNDIEASRDIDVYDNNEAEASNIRNNEYDNSGEVDSIGSNNYDNNEIKTTKSGEKSNNNGTQADEEVGNTLLASGGQTSASGMFTTTIQEWGQEIDLGWDHKSSTENLRMPESSESSEADDIVTEMSLQLGDQSVTVCEFNMLCSHRCVKTGRTVASEDINTETSNSFQESTYVYQKSTRYQQEISNYQSKESTSYSDEVSTNYPDDKSSHYPYEKPTTYRNENLNNQPLRQSRQSQQKGFHHFIKETIHSRQERNYWNQGLYSWNSKARNRRSFAESPEKQEYAEDATNTSWKCPEPIQAPCLCDALCVIYGDCCPDIFISCFNLTTTKDILEFISGMWSRHFPYRTADYDKTPPQTSDKYLLNLEINFATCENIRRTQGILVVSRCPKDNNDTVVKDKCESPRQILLPPVTTNFQNGDVTFRNIFCAQCHGFTEREVQVWRMEYSCQKDVTSRYVEGVTISDLIDFVQTGVCSVSFEPPANICEPRRCETYARLSDGQKSELMKNVEVGNCDEEYATLCRSYYSPKSGFANVHCRKCLQVKSRKRRVAGNGGVCDTGFHRNRQVTSEMVSSFNGGILLILDVTGSFSGKDKSVSSYVCPDDEVFDPKVLVCRSLICLGGFYPHRGKCLQVSDEYFTEGTGQVFPRGWDDLFLTLIVREGHNVLCNTFIDFPRQLNNSLSQNDSLSQLIVTSNKHLVIIKQQTAEATQNLGVNTPDVLSHSILTECQMTDEDDSVFTQLAIDILKWVFTSTSLKTSQLLTQTSHLASLGLFNDTYQKVLSNINSSTAASYMCFGYNTLHQVWNFSIVENNNTVYVLVNTSHRAIYYPLRSVGFQVTLSLDSNSSVLRVLDQSVYVCDRWMSLRDNCSVVQYSLNETLQNGSGLVILHSGVFYDVGNFEINGDEVLVCSDFSFHSQSYGMQQSLTYLILSWVFTSVSIFFLSLMLVLYCLLPELCTLPGKMTASLAATMMMTFLSNLLTLVDLHHDYVCPLVAALSHLITLAQFGWMSAIAVNMALTFGPLANTLVRTVTDRKLFLRYNLIVWGSSMTLVMTSVTLDLTHREPINTNVPETVPLDTSTYPRYGFPFCTWFSGPLWSKLAFVLIPYLVTFIISLVGFLLTLIGIQRTSRTAQKLGKKSSDKARCMIYFKLSSAMGFAWVLSTLVNVFPNSPVLPYIYLSLVLLQGVLLFWAFMVNHRVYQLVLDKLTAKRDHRSKSGTRNTSVVMTLSV